MRVGGLRAVEELLERGSSTKCDICVECNRMCVEDTLWDDMADILVIVIKVR